MKNSKLNPRESAEHMLLVLEEDIGQFPEHLTPKYPLPAIMNTEVQVDLLKEFGMQDGCGTKCLGTSDDALEGFIQKGRILRARIFIRQIRRNENADEARSRLKLLVEETGVSLESLKLKEEAYLKLVTTIH